MQMWEFDCDDRVSLFVKKWGDICVILLLHWTEILVIIVKFIEFFQQFLTGLLQVQLEARIVWIKGLILWNPLEIRNAFIIATR